MRQFIATILIDTFLLYTVYFSTEQQLTGRGYMIYTEWSGNLILAIVVMACNIRVIMISNQLNVMQGLLVSFGIISYFMITYLISIILQNELKNVIAQQFSTGIFWVLVIIILFSYSLLLLWLREATCLLWPFKTWKK
jgi:predicted cobalt transporter CbtA